MHISCELCGRCGSAAFVEELPQLGFGYVVKVLASAEHLVGMVAAPVERHRVVLGACYDAQAPSCRHEAVPEGI